jgi:signal transduction histidine kinase
VSGGIRAATTAGAACAFGLLLAPAVLPAGSPDVVVPSVLPLGFFVAGCVAQVLRPRHPVGDRLLAVGVLHLAALICAVGAALAAAPEAPLAWVSAVLYALGFAALLDLLARYPTGRYAWPAVGWAVRGAAAGAVVLVTLALLGSAETPSVLGLDTGPNPLHVPALSGVSSAVAVVALLPVAGLVLLLVRYRCAPAPDRAQMRWPIVTAAVTAAGLLTTGIAEELLGPDTQTAVFVSAAAALPLSFLVGLLRHTEEADRLAAVEASRARLAEVADAERRRIERDLHDGAQQRILALLTRVELARGGVDDDELDGIATELRAVHRELRELARGVYPATLADHGLPEALRSALARLPGAAELTVAPRVEGRRFPRAVEGAAYFLVLEGLANTMKHAGAAQVRVGLDATDDELRVTVSDSGRGFDSAAPDGTGLLGLRDRVAAVGGSLEIDSGPGRGTTLRGLLPAVGHAAG